MVRAAKGGGSEFGHRKRPLVNARRRRGSPTMSSGARLRPLKFACVSAPDTCRKSSAWIAVSYASLFCLAVRTSLAVDGPGRAKPQKGAQDLGKQQGHGFMLSDIRFDGVLS